jgi:mono/diheme cytochrome c family protein
MRLIGFCCQLDVGQRWRALVRIALIISTVVREKEIVKHPFRIVPAIVILAFAVWPQSELRAEPEPSMSSGAASESRSVQQHVAGVDEFQRYCALCHGADGRGMGPLTDEDAMKKSAADLTLITKRNGGVFPFSKVADTIRDGSAIAGHSQSRMIAWGKIFSAESDPVRAKAIIFDVTRYVEGLQEK